LLDSSNIDSSGWFQIARHIQASYNDYDSFVVLHMAPIQWLIQQMLCHLFLKI